MAEEQAFKNAETIASIIWIITKATNNYEACQTKTEFLINFIECKNGFQTTNIIMITLYSQKNTHKKRFYFKMIL